MRMVLEERQAINLKYSCACMPQRYAESHGQLLARRLEAWSFALVILLDSGVRSEHTWD